MRTGYITTTLLCWASHPRRSSLTRNWLTDSWHNLGSSAHCGFCEASSSGSGPLARCSGQNRHAVLLVDSIPVIFRLLLFRLLVPARWTSVVTKILQLFK
jgi:hypothetical protein